MKYSRKRMAFTALNYFAWFLYAAGWVVIAKSQPMFGFGMVIFGAVLVVFATLAPFKNQMPRGEESAL